MADPHPRPHTFAGFNLHFINWICRPPVGGLYVYYYSMTDNVGQNRIWYTGSFGLFPGSQLSVLDPAVAQAQ